MYCCPRVAKNKTNKQKKIDCLFFFFYCDLFFSIDSTAPSSALLDSCIISTTLLFADQMTWAGCSCLNASTHPFSVNTLTLSVSSSIESKVQLELLKYGGNLYQSHGARTYRAISSPRHTATVTWPGQRLHLGNNTYLRWMQLLRLLSHTLSFSPALSCLTLLFILLNYDLVIFLITKFRFRQKTKQTE